MKKNNKSKFDLKKWIVENKYGKAPIHSNYSPISNVHLLSEKEIINEQNLEWWQQGNSFAATLTSICEWYDWVNNNYPDEPYPFPQETTDSQINGATSGCYEEMINPGSLSSLWWGTISAELCSCPLVIEQIEEIYSEVNPDIFADTDDPCSLFVSATINGQQTQVGLTPAQIEGISLLCNGYNGIGFVETPYPPFVDMTQPPFIDPSTNQTVLAWSDILPPGGGTGTGDTLEQDTTTPWTANWASRCGCPLIGGTGPVEPIQVDGCIIFNNQTASTTLCAQYLAQPDPGFWTQSYYSSPQWTYGDLSLYDALQTCCPNQPQPPTGDEEDDSGVTPPGGVMGTGGIPQNYNTSGPGAYVGPSKPEPGPGGPIPIKSRRPAVNRAANRLRETIINKIKKLKRK